MAEKKSKSVRLCCGLVVVFLLSHSFRVLADGLACVYLSHNIYVYVIYICVCIYRERESERERERGERERERNRGS